MHKNDRAIFVKNIRHGIFIRIDFNSDDTISTHVKVTFDQRKSFNHNHAKTLIKNGYEFEVTNNVLRFNKTTHRQSFDIQDLCDMLEELL